MKIIWAISTTILFLFLMISVPVFSQDRDEAKPQQQEDKDKSRQDDKAARHDEGKHPQDQPAARQPGREQDDRRGQPEANRPQQEQRQNQEQRRNEDQHQDQDRRMDQRQNENQRMDRDHQQARSQRGQRIPDEKLRGSFGREHRFHVRREEIINRPQPVIVYGGYNFQLVDAWPAEWSYDDDVYVDYVDDGYYLFDPIHPGFRIAVIVIE
jgi:type IV secretory pathway VirB10-like protein